MTLPTATRTRWEIRNGSSPIDLLGFQLLHRLKAIHKQKLYRPEAGRPEAFPRLRPVLSRPINWDLIAQEYDQMVK